MNVLLLAGGDSSEKEISFSSAVAIHDALERLGHQITVLDPATGQKLLCCEGALVPLADEASESNANPSVLKTLADYAYDAVDVAMIALHGGCGENGGVQNILQMAGQKYTGSGMTASAAAMNKAMSKRLMSSVEVLTPRWGFCKVETREDAEELVGHVTQSFGFPLIIKPNDGGSTVGLTKVDDPSGMPAAIARSLEYSPEVLIEAYVAGRELTVSVFDGQAYPVVEIRPGNELYDYEAKYTNGKSNYLAPAPIEDDLAERIQDAAVRVYETIGAEGLARIDFILGEDGDFYCLELNTLPGMTALSLSPMAFKCEGIEFDGLIAMILDAALKRKE